MKTENTLERFIDAQQTDYSRALAEIRPGHKQSHWMGDIFPQLAGLGQSETARFYNLRDQAEARAYLNHPVLGPRLLEISNALLRVEGKTARQILDSPDVLKLRSSMTLFGLLKTTDPVFQAVLDQYDDGLPDTRTRVRVGRNP